MKTHPDIPLAEHIRGWLKTQQEYCPQLTEDMLLFYDEEEIVRIENGWSIKKKKLMNMIGFELFFEKLCSEGRAWITLGGDSWHSNYYLVSVEYSKQLDFSKTAIVRAGPSCG